ncbi:hypothetical protein PoB_003669100 [Plakobranchus ocellatus]|uniref:Galectin n=1 Tax=Plakobranchus ocellatus TaxID=259542 RepID=A0AAV4AUF8_9GAST|nr:hypothetical protein PoB_003669100 [Plakobranchus ocellatus]
MACPTDKEIERPRNLMEMVSSDASWRELGLRIKWTEPKLPSDANIHLGEPVRVRLAVEAKKDVSESGEEIMAFCWTNLKFSENHCGVWKDIKMHENPKCRSEGPQGVVTHVYQGSLAPDIDDTFRITFNVKWKKFMVWANQFQVDGRLSVSRSPRPEGEVDAPVIFVICYSIEYQTGDKI